MAVAAETIKLVSEETIKQGQAYWEGLTESNIDDYRQQASPNVRHKHPLNESVGIEAVLDDIRALFRNMKDIQFQMHDHSTNGLIVYQHWNLQFRHKRMPKKLWDMEGVSIIKFDENEKVIEHVDFYDLVPVFSGAPVLGWAVRFIKKSFGY